MDPAEGYGMGEGLGFGGGTWGQRGGEGPRRGGKGPENFGSSQLQKRHLFCVNISDGSACYWDSKKGFKKISKSEGEGGRILLTGPYSHSAWEWHRTGGKDDVARAITIPS